MSGIVWQMSDLMTIIVSAVLLLYLCKDALIWKKKYAQKGKYFFCAVYVLAVCWFDHSRWFQMLVYGESMEIHKSSATLVKVLLMMAVCFCLLDFFYMGKRLLKAYLAFLYSTLKELAMFGIHSVWSLCLSAYSDWQINRALAGDITLDDYMSHMQDMEYIWNLTLMLFQLAVVWLMIRTILKYRQDMREIDRQGILFLALSPAVGMAFVIILRCLFITRTETEYDFLYDKHQGMYAFVPLMSFLCLLSIVYSCKIYKELMRAQEEKNRMLFYEQQLADMTGHVREMERLYDGIRGMRHDMNNYIADLEQLFITGNEARPEGQQYLERMRAAMESLTLHCNTGNPVTDVIMNRKWQECDKEKIAIESDFLYPGQLGIEAFDLGILLNNALDNAIEACQKCAPGVQPMIRVHSYRKGSMFFLRIENNCDSTGILYAQDNTLLTTKEDDSMHGIGLKNMNSVVKRYFGTMSHEIQDGLFSLTVMLQGKCAEDNS
ncbi:MAG: ATP-binding protein [Roseburia sp.]|nr:ATP-binding protein [Roseburia sp.]MCM1242420.1 ATP-binding protein [Roseburia sp.]